MQTKLRVLHALEAFAGGTERQLLYLIEHTPDVEHIVAVPSLHLGKSTADAARRARELGAIVETVEMSRSPAPHHNVMAINSMRAMIRRYRPSIVHGHSSFGGAISRLSATRMQVPVVYSPQGLTRLRWALSVERVLRGRTDCFVVASEGERDFAVAERLAAPDRITIIRNGVDLEPPAPLYPTLRDRLAIPADAPLVGCVSRLTWQKAPEVYIAACGLTGRRLPEAHFVLITSGLPEGELEEQLRETQLGNRFHWVNGLPNAWTAFGEFDLFALSSRFEGGAYTPLDAMRAGTPLVLTDVPGNQEAVEHGVTGLLVTVDDPFALADGMGELLEDPARRAAFADAASLRLQRLFDVRKMGDETADLYRRLADDRRASLGQGLSVAA